MKSQLRKYLDLNPGEVVLPSWMRPNGRDGLRQFGRALWLVLVFSFFTPLLDPNGLPMMWPAFLIPGALNLALGGLYVVIRRVEPLRQAVFRYHCMGALIFSALGLAAWLLLVHAIVKFALRHLAALYVAFIPEVGAVIAGLLFLFWVIPAGGRLWKKLRLTWFTPIALFQVVVLVWYVFHFSGSTPEHCKGIYSQPTVSPLLSRDALDSLEDIGPAYPYDVAVDNSIQVALVTLKQKTGGYFTITDPPGQSSDGIAVVDLNSSEVLARIQIPSSDGATMPQNIVVDETLGVAAAYIVDRRMQHKVCSYRYSRSSIQKIRCEQFPEREPNSIVLDPKSHRVIVAFYAPGVALLWSAKLPDLSDIRRLEKRNHPGLMDKMGLSSNRDIVYIPSHTGYLTAYDINTFDRAFHRDIGEPLSAVAVDEVNEEGYLTGYLWGNLLRFSLEDGAILKTVDTVRAPRFIDVSPERGLLFVAGYVPGELAIHDLKTMDLLLTVETGELSRDLQFVPDLDAVLMATSCGVLMISAESCVTQ